MNEVDDAILEFYRLFENTIKPRFSLPPTVVWYNLVERMEVLDRSSKTISRRMNILNDMDLLELVDEKRRYFSITDKGLLYLDGDLDADDLELPDE